MRIWPLFGIMVFMLTSLIVGVRVMALWWKTKKLPELLLGIALLLVGFLAFAVGTAAKILITGADHLRSPLTILALTIEYAGTGALLAFAWRVFHPRERWATVLSVVLGGVIVTALGLELVSGEYMRYADSQKISEPYVLFGLAARGIGPTWMAFECFRYHGKLRRRQRLGLAEPLVVHRVALWGVGIGASALAYLASIAHRLAYGTGLREHEWALMGVSALAMVSAVSIALAFFPPRSYRRWAKGSSEPPPRSSL